MSSLEDNFNKLWYKHLEKLKLVEEQNGLDDPAFKFSVPRIVAIGEESSGKSSTLERIAMLKIFPSDRRLCTRMPIELRLRYMDKMKLPEEFRETGYVEMELIRSEDSQVDNDPRSELMRPSDVSEKVREWMEDLVERNNGGLTGVTSDRLIIKLFSSRKLNLDLIDLPGIVAGSIRDEPSDMMDRTRKIAGSFLNDPNNPHTFVIAVVSATETRIRNSQAMELVQRYNKENMTIGALTMADLAADRRTETNPYGILKARLDGSADDLPNIDLGYFALKNRDTSDSVQSLNLVSVNEDEERWFKQNLPDHTNQCGIDSLIAKLVCMLESYTLEKWVKAERERLSTLREEVTSKMNALGEFLPSNVTELVQRFRLKFSERVNKMTYATTLKICTPPCVQARPPVVSTIFVDASLSVCDIGVLKNKKDHTYDSQMFLNNGWMQIFNFDLLPIIDKRVSESTVNSIEEKCMFYPKNSIFFIGEKLNQGLVKGIFVSDCHNRPRLSQGNRNLLNELNQLFSSAPSNTPNSQNQNNAPLHPTNLFPELFPNDGKKFVLVLQSVANKLNIVLPDRRLAEGQYFEGIRQLRNLFYDIITECIVKFWKYLVDCVMDDYRQNDGRFENFCNSVEVILRTRGTAFFDSEVRGVIVPWLQTYFDKAVAEAERLQYQNSINENNSDSTSKCFIEQFQVLFRRSAKLNFATPLASKIAEELFFNLQSATKNLSEKWFHIALNTAKYSNKDLCRENCEDERKILNSSKENVVDMLNALADAFSNSEINEPEETANDLPAQQSNPSPPAINTAPESGLVDENIQRETNVRRRFRFGRRS
jgi:hypothetical protein